VTTFTPTSGFLSKSNKTYCIGVTIHEFDSLQHFFLIIFIGVSLINKFHNLIKMVYSLACNLRKETMKPFDALKLEFGVLANLAKPLGVRENAIYQWSKRGIIPIKHIRTLIDLSEGRLTKEVLRPDLFKKD
jgi:hypothetical protein